VDLWDSAAGFANANRWAGKGVKMIALSEQLPDKEEYFSLFNTTGWNNDYKASPDDLERANQNSWLVVSAYDENNLVGFGRAVTDYVLHAMIFDMIVLPDYQGRGIGTMILSRLVNRCLERGIRDIQLFCAKGKRAFYEKNGFEVRADDAPGMQLKKQERHDELKAA
jgi:GNAT superfamily N-acetyltransferase